MPCRRGRVRGGKNPSCCAPLPISTQPAAMSPSTARSGARYRRKNGGGGCAIARPSRPGGATRRANVCRRIRASIASCNRWTSMHRCSIGRLPCSRPASASALPWSGRCRRAEGAAARRADRRARPQSTALTEELIRFQLLSGHSVVLVSHDQAQVERLAHARLLLAKANGGANGAGARGHELRFADAARHRARRRAAVRQWRDLAGASACAWKRASPSRPCAWWCSWR